MKKYTIEYDLSTFNREQLCEIWNEINRWEWPPLLGEKPLWWDDIPDYLHGHVRISKPNKFDIIKPIMEDLHDIVPNKARLRYHHIHNLNRTPEQFEAWWQEEYIGRM